MYNSLSVLNCKNNLFKFNNCTGVKNEVGQLEKSPYIYTYIFYIPRQRANAWVAKDKVVIRASVAARSRSKR